MYIVYCSMNSGQHFCEYAISHDDINKHLENLEFRNIDRDEYFSITYKNPIFISDEKSNWVTINMLPTRDVFMDIYRDEYFNERGVSADDRHEVFGGIMFGNSDFDAEEINVVLADYGVGDIQAVDITEDYPAFCARLDNLREMSKEYHDKGDLKH